MHDDHAEALSEAVRRACERREPFCIAGSGSKAFLTGGPTEGRIAGDRPAANVPVLSVTDHRGVLDYRPEELVITARSGTPLRDLERTLAQAGQHLPFEPPRFRGGGTVGGAVAAGLSGPGRPWRGSVRDVLLGVELVNGRGERLRFGGQVMKNVAGYDVARLQAGAFGTLGLMLAVSIKVLPRPQSESTRCFELGPAAALARCRQWAREPHPITGTCHHRGRLWVRLAGAEAAVREAERVLGGDPGTDPEFWGSLRDHRLEPLAEGGRWRCVLPPAAAEPLEDCVTAWAGAERWWRPPSGTRPEQLLAAQGGHGRPFDGTFGIRIGSHLKAVEQRYAWRLKRAFDPEGILNPHLVTEPGHAD